MIPVRPQPEPPSFDAQVRKPGQVFLAKHLIPTNWRRRDYWTRALDDLSDAYLHICAYSAEWIPPTTGARTVDHFTPKTVRPELAYEWSNFRLACSLMNSRKGDFTDVADPLTLREGTFILAFPSLAVDISHSLPDEERRVANATIRRLKLNDHRCVEGRWAWLQSYCRGDCSFQDLSRKAPFLAYELERQGLADRSAIAACMKDRLTP